MTSLRIVSEDPAPFEDREEAGRLLARELESCRREHPLVLGVPRGGLVVGRALADALGGELDAVFVLKLRFPGLPEVAAGAVTGSGSVILGGGHAATDTEREEFKNEIRERGAELARRAALVRGLRPRIDCAGRTVVVTDDGVATGHTLGAALRAVRGERPRRLVCAVPIGLRGAVEILSREADLTVALRCPPGFLAVGQFYRRFPQVGDEEIARLFAAG